MHGTWLVCACVWWGGGGVLMSSNTASIAVDCLLIWLELYRGRLMGPYCSSAFSYFSSRDLHIAESSKGWGRLFE